MEEVQILGKAELIKTDKIPEVVSEMLTRHRSIVGDLEVTLPAIKAPGVKEFLEKRLNDSKKIIQVLEKGFIPVMIESPIGLKPKSGLAKAELEELMKTLPPEAEAALERAKKLGIFDQFAVSGGPRGGDPVIVGVIRNKFFLIAAWVNVDGGGAIGYTFRQKATR